MKNLNKFRNYISNIIIIVVLLSVYFVTYASGTLQVFSTSSFDAIYNGNKENNNVTLMVNVYWGTEYIDDMLNTFDKYNIKTTFFVGGVWVSKNCEMLVKINEKGHEIGNHGYFHKDHRIISEKKNYDEISSTHELVKKYTSKNMNLFAPPSGSFNNTTLKIAQELGYKTIMWTKDTIDWRDKNTELIFKRATKNPCNGDLILMHPTKNTVDALSQIIDFYQNNNYKLTTVSQNIL